MNKLCGLHHATSRWTVWGIEHFAFFGGDCPNNVSMFFQIAGLRRTAASLCQRVGANVVARAPGKSADESATFSACATKCARAFFCRVALQFELAVFGNKFRAALFLMRAMRCVWSDPARASVEFEYRKERRNLLVIKPIAIAAVAGPKGGMQSGVSSRPLYNYAPLPRSHHFRAGRARIRHY